MPSKSKVTTDHEEIRRWAEERGGKPARVKRTGGGDDPGILRIDFPGYSGADSLEEISWDEFFRKFDENGLALLYQETTAGGQRSNFNKLISRETEQAASGRNGGRSRGSTRTQARSSRSARAGARASSSRRSSSGSAQSRSARSSSRTQSGRSRKSRGSSSDEVCLPRTELRKLKAGSRSTQRSRGASSKSRSQPRSARAVSSKKSSRASRGNQGRRAA